MAAVALSPSPAPIASIMIPRRGPLTNNQNAANSPLRPAAASKPKRSHATNQREESYGQPPPKKQALDNGSQRPIRSPTKVPRPQVAVQRDASTTQRTAAAAAPRSYKYTTKTQPTTRAKQPEGIDKETWKAHYRAKFPNMVFYFESVPDDVRAKLTKRITYLNARQEPFFSNEVTHVVTTRPIPTAQSETQQADAQAGQQEDRGYDEQPKTINPSLLDRSAAQRKLLVDFRSVQSKSQGQDPLKLAKGGRGNDVLNKAREMGKKIWTLEKFNQILSTLLEVDTHKTAESKISASRHGVSKSAQGSGHLLTQMLHNERINGPSDRDPTASIRELHHFRGPHLYVWDMDEKQKPIMVREYAKVANKSDGDWPQFRSVGSGRCPFVEEVETTDRKKKAATEQEKEKVKVDTKVAAAVQVPAKVDRLAALRGLLAAAPAVGVKRTLAEMEHGQNKGRDLVSREFTVPDKAASAKSVPQNAFVSRAPLGQVRGGEPVASGLQPNSVTSAIRSQMISSTTGVSGVKAGTSREIQDLQRKVLQKTAPVSQLTSSRLATEASGISSSRPTTLSRQTSRTAPNQEQGSKATEAGEKAQPLKSKKDLKPGYCENCQDKYRDFEEHIASRKHRRFAENADNWTDLDNLLAELKRVPRHMEMDVDNVIETMCC